MKTIFSKNLFLRPLRVGDVTKDYVHALRDEEVIKFTEARYTRWTENKVLDYVKNINVPFQSQLIGIFLKENKKHIGNIRLLGFSKMYKRVDLGIMVFDKRQWSKGYGTESLTAICDYIFKVLGFHKICAGYYSLNKASHKMFKKVGFKVEGALKDHYIFNGRYVDFIRVAKIR